MADASADASTTRRHWRTLGQGLAWVLLAIAVYFLWPVSLGGGTSLVVVSGQSMEPTYRSGDMVIARTGEPRVGDVIVYAPEDLGGAQVVHRIIGGDGDEGWVLQGDNNDFIDPFTPGHSEVRGIVELHVPNAGVVTMWLLNPLLWLGVILIALVIALWPASYEDDEDDEDDSPAEPTDGADVAGDDPVDTRDTDPIGAPR